VDEKIPREKRKTTPILVDREKIIWIVGYRIDDRAKVKPETKKVLIIKLREI
jgi:tRNA(Ile)-lysidine synthase